MIRKLLMTTAISLIATSGAMAQNEQDKEMSAQPMAEDFMQELGQAELASEVIGETVYASEADDAEAIGDINDLVIADDGSIDAVVIGVGGFLGVGEKSVAVKFDSIRWVENENGEQFAVYEASKESLQNAPEFTVEERTAMTPAGEAPEGTEMAPEGETGEQTAMAPEGESSEQTAMAPEGEASEETAMAPEGEASEETAMAPADPAAEEGEETAMTAGEQPAEETEQAATAEEPMEESMEPAEETAMAPTEEPMDEAMTGDQAAQPQLADVKAGSVSAEQLLGATVYTSNDEDVGEIGDVRLGADSGEIDAIIVDVGGFLGLGEKPVAIGFQDLTIRKDEGGSFYIYTKFTREELEGAPSYDEAAYDEQRDSMRLTTQ